MLFRSQVTGRKLVLVDDVLTSGATANACARALLRAGVAELVDFADTPAQVIINEYLNVAHSFVPAHEAGFVNGVLDRLARRLRTTEVGADGPRQEER